MAPDTWPRRVQLDASTKVSTLIASGAMRLRLGTDSLLHRAPKSFRSRCELPAEGHRLLGIDSGQFDELRSEVIVRSPERAIRTRLEARFPSGAPFLLVGTPSGAWLEVLRVLYVLVRAHRPRVVVETGVGPVGATSAFILEALRANDLGRLVSVDSDRYGAAYGVELGEGISEALAARHTLVVADSRHSLAQILSQLPPVDLFLHDSDHSFANMFAEFATAWPQLRSGGFLLADDCNNNALDEFARRQSLRPTFVKYFDTEFGMVRHP